MVTSTPILWYTLACVKAMATAEGQGHEPRPKARAKDRGQELWPWLSATGLSEKSMAIVWPFDFGLFHRFLFCHVYGYDLFPWPWSMA